MESSIDRAVMFKKALGSLESRYISGFWTWLKEERPVEYEIINHFKENIYEQDKGGTDEHFRNATKQWWGRIAANILEYSKDEGAQAEYKGYL